MRMSLSREEKLSIPEFWHFGSRELTLPTTLRMGPHGLWPSPLLAEIVTPEGSKPHCKHEEVCEEHRKLQSQQEVR
jgi:hypothetical protein